MKNWTRSQKELMKSWMTKNPDSPDLSNPTRTVPQVSTYHLQYIPIINTASYVSILSRVSAGALIHFILGFDQRIWIGSKYLFSSWVSAGVSDASNKVNKERRKRSTVTI
jgi:hypothetical protein